MHPCVQSIPRARQRGFALFVGLIMLVLISLIGITAMQVTVMQERMAGNFKVQHDQFESGESKLSGSEGRGKVSADPSSFGIKCFIGGCVRLITGGSPTAASQFPWINWLTSEPTLPATPQINLLWRPQLGAGVPAQISLNYYSVAAIAGTDEAKTALQGVYLLCTNCSH